jgi:hypothetical protein
MIDRMKANGERKKIQKTIETLRKQVITDIPKDLAYHGVCKVVKL